MDQFSVDVEGTRPSTGATIKVWDPIVRLFHWTVVCGVILNLWILEEGKYWHRVTGYVIAAVLTVRLVWGVAGTRYARFTEFFPTPSKIVGHLRELKQGHVSRHVGHSPLGAVMMLALMGLLAFSCLTGWLMGTDVFWGNKLVKSLHALSGNMIMVLALLHAASAIFESWRLRENLVWSMVTGKKRR
ncbi:cytochrome b/b6 domain-containing protein [Phyllobacterium sp. LjRoot231]|uniref:cytochrome b/b6 domain-containing protein n=1 Tax=Phyllobacterium sp. LjRoot231 TaxID=3342289 RepID=UPI003ECE7DDB